MSLKNKQKGFVVKALDRVERVGNKLPDPAVLFVILAFITIVLSFIVSKLNVSVTYEGYNSATNAIEEMTVTPFNLLTREGIVYMVTSIVGNFTGFFALGTVFTIIIGVSVAEGTGFLEVALKKIVAATPKALVTSVVVLLGIMSNVASSVGYVVLVPLGAIVFMAFKRHPIAGLAAAFSGVSGGWTANLLIGSNDPLYAGISTQAAQMLDPNYTVLPVANWYFMIVSTFLITFIGTWVTDKIVEPRLKPYVSTGSHVLQDITLDEKRGMRFAGIATLVYVVTVLLLVLPENAILRNPSTGSIIVSPFMSGIIFFMMLLFLIPGLFFGIGARVLKSNKDVIQLMAKGISSLSSFMVLIFFAAQFTAFFNKSNLGIILSVSGANFLESVGFVGLPLLISFVLLTAFINIFIAVDTAKWAIMAPIFVPMLMRLNLSPELTQAAYRIGDSSTNIIAPLMPFFVLTVAFFQKYDEDSGIGSVISTMLPYSVFFLVGWILLLSAWYMLGLPLGPGSPLFY